MSTTRAPGADDGFTLVELLTVIVILGVLVAISAPTFLGQREKGYLATLESDLRQAAASQEVWAVEHAGTYAADVADLGREGFQPSRGVVVSVERVGVDGFCLSAEHDSGNRLYYSTESGAPTSVECA